MNANNALKNIIKELKDKTGLEFRYGYTGNIEKWGDDRKWFISAPHKKIGKSHDSWGHCSTFDELVIKSNLRYESLIRWAERWASNYA